MCLCLYQFAVVGQCDAMREFNCPFQHRWAIQFQVGKVHDRIRKYLTIWQRWSARNRLTFETLDSDCDEAVGVVVFDERVSAIAVEG